MSKKEVCIFLNGTPPHLTVIRNVIKRNSYLVCADGAANYLKRMGIIPNVILGDLDSIRPAVKNYFEKRTKIIRIPDQDTTDFEKVLIYCKQNKIKKAYVIGFSSQQADHTLANYSVMKKYSKTVDLQMVDNNFFISFVPNKLSFSYPVGEIISLLPFPSASGIATSGLQYPLKAESLHIGKRDGIRNRSTSSRVVIKFKSGHLLLFRRHFLDT